jgi:repressor LexA
MKGLTPRQRQILDYITESIMTRGYPPTIREIGDEMGIKSTRRSSAKAI